MIDTYHKIAEPLMGQFVRDDQRHFLFRFLRGVVRVDEQVSLVRGDQTKRVGFVCFSFDDARLQLPPVFHRA